MKILIADDHDIVRAGIKGILLGYDPACKLLEASNGKEALDLIMDQIPDLAILDVAMPKLTGLEVLNQITESGCGCKVLILSMYPEKQYAIRAFRSGAFGYLTKDNASEELVKAIKQIEGGRKYVSPDLQDIFLEFTADPTSASPHLLLSDREFKVFIQLAEGKSIQQIADLLFISAKTVSTYKARVMEKMSFSNVAELTRYALKNNLIT